MGGSSLLPTVVLLCSVVGGFLRIFSHKKVLASHRSLSFQICTTVHTCKTSKNILYFVHGILRLSDNKKLTYKCLFFHLYLDLRCITASFEFSTYIPSIHGSLLCHFLCFYCIICVLWILTNGPLFSPSLSSLPIVFTTLHSVSSPPATQNLIGSLRAGCKFWRRKSHHVKKFFIKEPTNMGNGNWQGTP